MKVLRFTEFLYESRKAKKLSPLSEMMDQEVGLYDDINEGGAYGHVEHPFEDTNLTMGQLLDMIKTTINGSFGPENFVQEKTDGQQISISWKDGKLIAARSKKHMSNAGQDAMRIEDIAEKFKGRGDIEIVYNAAMRDLTNSIGALSDKDKERYFANGQKFASLEIITPTTQNTVPYGLNMLVFHGVVEYDENGVAIGEDKQAGRDLGKLIKDANAEAQEMFYVRGPQDMDIKPFPKSKERGSYYMKKYNTILKDNNLTSSSTIKDYATNRAINILNDEINKVYKNFSPIPEDIVEKLAERIAGISKAYRVNNMKKDGVEVEVVQWYNEWEKKNTKVLKRKVYAPLENLFIEVGTEFMRNMSSFLSANPTEATESMRKEIESTIAELKKSGDETQFQKLEHELQRITAAGGLESIVPTEGITFIYNGKLYKYTGIFAPIHQIRSMLAYKK